MRYSGTDSPILSGSWGSLRTLLLQDENGKAKVGRDIRLYECKNCAVHAADESRVVVLGLDGLS